MKKHALIILVLLFAQQAYSSVWNHNPSSSWSIQWQQAYSDWIKNDVDGDFFKKLGRPYSRLKVDCADAHYALVAWFARENNLPFAVQGGRVTNMTDRFDSIRNSEDRMVAFMNFLRSNYGTESLSHSDTFPPAISDVSPGDVFMYKVGSGGNFTRHTYIIKAVNPNGTFDVLYSTQANAAKAGALKSRTNFMFPHAPNHRSNADYQYWGFRRMKLAHEMSVDHKNISNASFEQYDWAISLSKIAFFDKVQSVLKTINESPEVEVERLFGHLCNQVQDRIGIVKEAVEHARRLGGACMDYQDYDAHSTPSRDTGIKSAFETLLSKIQVLSAQGNWSQVPWDLQDVTVAIYGKNPSNNSLDHLYDACPIKYGNGTNQETDLREFRESLFGGLISFHPNDNLNWRWGFPDGRRTQCKEWYGYPE